MATRSVRERKSQSEEAPPQTADAGVEASSPDKVVDTIHRGILTGRYVPGQKLIEADLTLSLGISRGPVREALKRLDAEGVVELTRHRGAYIRAMSREEAMDFLAILEVLTGLIARLAANAITRNHNADIVREAFSWLERFRDPNLDNVAFLEERSHFYDTLIAIGGNSQLPAMMPTMRIHLLRLQVQPYFSREDRQDRVEEYASITQAVLDSDPAGAQKAMRQHMKRMQQRIVRLPDDAFARRS